MNVIDEIETLVNLASPKMGSKVISVSDDFFGKASRMLDDKDPVFIEDKYDDHGKWMDGWESRRRRDGGHDWAIIKLGSPGVISKAEIDTSHFTGNFPPFTSLEGLFSEETPNEKSNWVSLIKKTSLIGNQKNAFIIESTSKVNYVRLQIFPDGGVARIRLFGEVKYDWNNLNKDELIELSSLKLGGSIVAFNNAHYGDVSALLSDGRGKTMGDGWETRRRRDKGFDWLIINSIKGNKINKIEISTHHFKGNFPSHCTLQATYIPNKKTSSSIVTGSNKWKLLLDKVKLSANKTHIFKNKLMKNDKINYIKINIYPDGGISRFKIFGKAV